MYSIELTSRFRKKYLMLTSANKELKSKITRSIELLKKDPKYSSLRTHKVVIQSYGEVFSSYVTGDIRIIWKKHKNELVLLLLDIGRHSGKHSVYK